MKMLCVLIVDDEPIAREILRKYCQTLDYIGEIIEAPDGIKALSLLNQYKIDVILLDINMPVLKGIDLVKSIPKLPHVIFTTAYSEYAAEAFNVDATDYLLKPISFERFIKAMQKVISSYAKPEIEKAEKIIQFKSQNVIYKIAECDIIYCESKGNYVRMFLENSKTMDYYITTEKFLAMLSDAFVRIHRSFIVNRNKVAGISNTDVHLSNTVLPIGNSYKNEVRSAFGEKFSK